MKIPANASPEIQAAFRELHQRLDELKRTDRTQDLHGSRIGNTGIPVEARDYANKGYVDAMIKKVLTHVDKVTKVVKRVATSGGGGTPAPPGALIDFGYWYVDTVVQGQFEPVVKAWTNLAFVFDRDGGTSDTPPSERMANITSICGRLAAAGFKIALDIGPNSFLQPQQMLDAAAPSWAKVGYVLLGDEINMTVAEANAAIADAKTRMSNMGLALKPIGATLDVDTGLTSQIVNANWDFLNIEAYVTADCQSGNCPEPADILACKVRVQQTMARIPAAINIAIVMQAYDLSGALTNIPILAQLNAATYFQMAKGNARVKMINMFAYSRTGGSKDHPELVEEHKRIWADMNGGTVPVGGEKKCAGDPRNCVGLPVCCNGGLSNPCNCPRLCEGGQYMQQVETSTIAMIQAHPELFAPGSPPVLLGQTQGVQLVGYIAAYIITNYPTIKAIPDPGDGKQMLVRQLVLPTFREDYRVWNSDLTIALPSGGGYRATCWGEDLTW